MSLDIALSAAACLVATVLVLLAGKWAYAATHRKHLDIREELLERDNLAFAISLGGYYFGLVIAVGGSLFGPHGGWLEDGTETLLFGLLAVVLLNVSRVINERVVLRKFDPIREIVADRNVGTGAVAAASHIANGLVLLGALSGEEVSLLVAVVFWALAQVVFIGGAVFYDAFNPIDVHAEIERDNVAVGVAFAGVLVALGNVARLGASGDFVGWRVDLSGFFIFVALGLILLPVMRTIADRVILTRKSLTAEMVCQERPNVGVGVIEAVSYIAGSFLIGWIL